VIAGKWPSVAGRARHSDGSAPRRERAAVGWIWRAWAALVVAARYVILLAWIAAAVAATFYLAPLTPASGIGGLVPSGAPALQAEYDSARIFGLLALVSLAQFRQIALAMVLGILLDTFVVRSLLVPALVVLFGRVGSWPGRTARPVPRPAGSPAAEDLQGSVAYRD
jgi:uncharacterized membrane protein YdfJ with MMPL/SSD domain